MPDQEEREPRSVGGDLVHGDKFDLSGTFTGPVYAGSTIHYHTGPAGAAAERRSRIFLSYAWGDDKPFVERLQKELQDAGFDVWRDETDLQSRGPDLTQELIREIDGRARFVPVIGPAAFKSAAVQAEWRHAILKCKAITPVWRLGDQEPPAEFKAKLYVDFREDGPGFNYKAGLDHLVGLLAEKPRLPGSFLTRFPDLPPGVIPRRELEPLRKLLDPLAAGGGTVAITGLSAARTVQAPGGLGKSVLAAIFARECRTRWAFEDGLVWLTVGKTPIITALQAELGALFGIKPDEFTDERAGASILQRILQKRHVLIVLDDVWNYHHVEPLVVDAPGCRWLITTRLATVADGLGLTGERVIKLEYLSDDEGLALIARRLETAVDNLPDRANCLAIVRELDGHTQAIAIAAARLRQGLPPADLLARYRRAKDGDNPLALLNIEEKRELNLEMSFGESYAFMDEAGRRRVRRLGVFAPDGTFDATAAAAVWEEDEDSAGDGLRDLVAASLLTTTGVATTGVTTTGVATADGGRYEQHGLIRAYALGLLRRAGEEADARQRHFDYYHVEYGDGDRNVPYIDGRHDQIDDDFANIQRAIEWGLPTDPQPACDLVIALAQNYMQFRQPAGLRLDFLQKAHAAAKNRNYKAGEANTLQAIGDVQNFRKELEAALASYEAALGLYRAVGARVGEANTLKAIGDVQNFRKELEAALASYEAALGLYRAVGHRLGEANTRQQMGFMLLSKGEREDGLRVLDEALALHQAVGDKVGQANIYFRLAMMVWQNGSPQSAEPLLAQAVELGRQIDPNHPTIRGWNEMLTALRAELAAGGPQLSNDD